MLDLNKRKNNEKRFRNWKELSNGHRIYHYEILGRHGWKAQYVKEVDENEITVRFYQDIYNEDNVLVERQENILLIKVITDWRIVKNENNKKINSR